MFITHKLIEKIENFYKSALFSYQIIKSSQNQPTAWTMPDDEEEDKPWTPQKTDNSLLDRADDFDIKNEDLFNQFESYMDAYRELIAALGMNPQSLNQDTLEDSVQLIDTLKTRQKRLLENPYLNKPFSDEWEEDEEFDPGDFTQLVLEIGQDAENRLKNVAGEDIDISEAVANTYANEFNAIQEEHKGTKEEKWSAERIQKAREARQNWFKNLMMNKKLNINNPQYQGYIQSRRRYYTKMREDLEKDPVRKAKYLKGLNDRQSKFYWKLDKREKELLAALQQPMSDKRKLELEAELVKVREGLAKKKDKGKQEATKIKDLKESETLPGYIRHLGEKIASLKKDTAKTVKNKAERDPQLVPYKNAIAEAKRALDAGTPGAQQALEKAVLAAQQAADKYTDTHEITVKVRNDIQVFYAYRDKIKEVSKSGFLNTTIPEVAKVPLKEIIKEGLTLIKTYSSTYSGIATTLTQIVKLIGSKVLG